MSCLFTRWVLPVFVFVNLIAAAAADAPRLISYQGKLRDSNGTAVTGAVSLRIRLYDHATQTSPILFDETHPSVGAAQGLFQILIGSVNGGVPDAALDAANVYLGVSVNGTAELLPRTRIASDAHAVKSLSSERLVRPGTFETAVHVDVGGRVGVGTAGPDSAAALEVSSAARGFLPPRMDESQRDAIADPPAGLLVFNTTSNTLNMFDGAEWVAFTATSTTIPANTHSIDLERSSAQYLSSSDNVALRLLGNFTVEAWVKPESIPSSDSPSIISKENSSGGWNLRMNAPTGIITWIKDDSDVSLASSPFSAGTWYHVAVTYSGSTIRLYINGSEVSSTSYTSHADVNADLNVGRSGRYTNRLWDGLIDEVRIWSVARSAAELSGNMSTQIAGGTAGLIAYYRLNTTLSDESPNGSNLTNNNGAPFVTDLPF